MPHRPPADRIDALGFTCRETGQLLDRSPERVRQLCVEAPGFGVRAPDGAWRIPPINALAAFAIQRHLNGHRGLGAAEFARRTMNGTNALRAIGQIIAENPDLRAEILRRSESVLAGWWERHRHQPPPDDVVPNVPATAEAEGVHDVR